MDIISLDSKLPTVGESIFSVMSALAREQQALNLSQGFPDFNCDPLLMTLVEKAMRSGMNQYAPSHGLPALREQISALTEELYAATYDPESEVTVMSGATEALHCAISAIVNEGDEVLIFEPAYDSYVPVIELNGGQPVYIPLELPEYKVDWEMVKKRVNSSTRLIILNSPHNPTGAVLSAQDLHELEKIVGNNKIFVLSDEVYEHMIYDGREHQSVARYPNLRPHSIIVSSFGKTFHTTGWKIGYALAPANLTREMRKIHQFVTFSTATPFQAAIAEYMQQRDHILELKHFYQAKRDFFRQAVDGSRFKVMDCAGTYFQLLEYSAISEEKDVEFARRMTIENKIASIPVSVFYHGHDDHKVLRFCFAKENETLERAAEILHRI